MSKKLKTLLFILIAVVVASAIGVGGYFLVDNLSAVTVNNLRILAFDDTPIKNTDVYLQDKGHNSFLIKVDVDSTGTNSVYFVSSNPSVASVSWASGGYRVSYYKAGKTTITCYSNATDSVRDSFVLSVHENFVADIVVDEKYDNIIEVYGNGKVNTFNYKATGVLANEYANNELIRVVEDYDTSVLKSVSIDKINKKLNIETQLVKENSTQILHLQSYYVDADGVEHTSKNYFYTLNVVGFNIKEIQLILSQDQYFADKTHIYLHQGIDETKAFKQEGEVFEKNIYLTQTVDTVYFATRVVYTDGSFEYSPISGFTSESQQQWIKPEEPAVDSNVWTAKVQQKAIEEISQEDDDFITISYRIEVGDLELNESYTFRLTYVSLTRINNKPLYKFVDEQYYEYNYWDTRFKRTDAIVKIIDGVARIVGFENGAPVV